MDTIHLIKITLICDIISFSIISVLWYFVFIKNNKRSLKIKPHNLFENNFLKGMNKKIMPKDISDRLGLELMPNETGESFIYGLVYYYNKDHDLIFTNCGEASINPDLSFAGKWKCIKKITGGIIWCYISNEFIEYTETVLFWITINGQMNRQLSNLEKKI